MTWFTEFRQAALNVSGGAIAILLAVMLSFCLYALVFYPIPEANENALLVLIGILSRDFATVVNFHFSSTSQNKKLAETVNMQAKTAQTAGVALGVGTETLTIAPDEAAKVTPTDDGAVISKTPDKPKPRRKR